MLDVDWLELGLTTPVLKDPCRDMLLVTELLDALELDRLKFSFELVVIGCWRAAVREFVDVRFDFAMFRALRIFSVDLWFCLVAFKVADLFRDLVDEFMLGLLPPFKLLIGLRSRSLNKLLLFLGWITDVDDDNPSSLPFRKFLVISFDRSLILFSAVRGFSGGRLVALKLVMQWILNIF